MDDARLSTALTNIEKRAVGTNQHLAELKTGTGQIHAMCAELVAWTQEPPPKSDLPATLRAMAAAVAGLDAKLDELAARIDALAARLPAA